MSSLSTSLLCLVVVVIAGRSLKRQAKLNETAYRVIVGIVAVAATVSAILLFMAEHRAEARASVRAVARVAVDVQPCRSLRCSREGALVAAGPAR